MVRPLMTDVVFLAQKALPADAGDLSVACICVCPQIIIPSGKSILLLGIFMPFWGCKRRTIT